MVTAGVLTFGEGPVASKIAVGMEEIWVGDMTAMDAVVILPHDVALTEGVVDDGSVMITVMGGKDSEVEGCVVAVVAEAINLEDSALCVGAAELTDGTVKLGIGVPWIWPSEI